MSRNTEMNKSRIKLDKSTSSCCVLWIPISKYNKTLTAWFSPPTWNQGFLFEDLYRYHTSRLSDMCDYTIIVGDHPRNTPHTSGGGLDTDQWLPIIPIYLVYLGVEVAATMGQSVP